MFKKPKPPSKLDDLIDAATLELNTYQMHTPEYAAAADQLTKLYAIKNDVKSDRVSKDTLAIVLGNLAGIVVIVGHERAHVVTSKALNFILKAK